MVDTSAAGEHLSSPPLPALRVTAEGVETPAQADALRELGCHSGRVYTWSRPLPADPFHDVLCQPLLTTTPDTRPRTRGRPERHRVLGICRRSCERPRKANHRPAEDDLAGRRRAPTSTLPLRSEPLPTWCVLPRVSTWCVPDKADPRPDHRASSSAKVSDGRGGAGESVKSLPPAVLSALGGAAAETGSRAQGARTTPATLLPGRIEVLGLIPADVALSGWKAAVLGRAQLGSSNAHVGPMPTSPSLGSHVRMERVMTATTDPTRVPAATWARE